MTESLPLRRVYYYGMEKVKVVNHTLSDARQERQHQISREQAIQAIRLALESRDLPDVTPLQQSRTIAKIVLESEFAPVDHRPGSREYNELVDRLSVWTEREMRKMKVSRKKRS